jgi:hypothetical protein
MDHMNDRLSRIEERLNAGFYSYIEMKKGSSRYELDASDDLYVLLAIAKAARACQALVDCWLAIRSSAVNASSQFDDLRAALAALDTKEQNN